MSYCRFSSDSFWCDVYCYEDVMGGFTTHVARTRLVVPPIPEYPLERLPLVGTWDPEQCEIVYKSRWLSILAMVMYWAWGRSHALHLWSVSRWPRAVIGLPFDGETFNDPTAADAAARLEHLLSLGYRIPQSAIRALRAEQED